MKFFISNESIINRKRYLNISPMILLIDDLLRESGVTYDPLIMDKRAFISQFKNMIKSYNPWKQGYDIELIFR